MALQDGEPIVGYGLAEGRLEDMAAEQTDDHIWNIYYRNVLLGYFDERKFMKKEKYQELTRPEVYTMYLKKCKPSAL